MGRHGGMLALATTVALVGAALASCEPTYLGCAGDDGPFSPTDLAFGAAGELYVTDAANGSVRRLEGERCAALAEGWHRPYGVAVLDDGRVCVSHFTSDDPLTREAAVSCWDGADWALEVRGIGSGVQGLAASPDGLWLAASEDTPVEARAGLLLLLSERGIGREVRLEDGWPRFLAALPEGGLLISLVREDASGITARAVLERSPDGRLTRLEPGFAAPAGIGWSDQGVWIVDEVSGDLALLTPDGRRLIHPRFARGASGLAVSAEGEVCVADPGRSSITCARSAVLFGEETQHED